MKNYKILFISINNVWRYGNIGMDQLAGYLRKKGFEIDIKYFSNKKNAEEVVNELNLDYKMIAFSINNSNYNKCCEIAKIIKKKNKSIFIEFGGGFSTRYYNEVLQENKEVDFVILGDGEKPFEFLLEKLINFSNERIRINHSSIATHSEFEKKYEFLNQKIEHLPIFDYYEKDSKFKNSRKVHCIQTKNNICTGKCTFCTERHGKIFYKDLDEIIEQIKIVHEKYGVKKIFFTDDNILDPNDNFAKLRLIELCKKIEKLDYKLAFQCYMKAISIKNDSLDDELLKYMKKVGFVEVFIGLESGNQEDLELYNKLTTVEDNYNIINKLTQHGLVPIIGFITFNPYSTLDRIRKNFRFLCNIKCTYLFNYLYSFVVIDKYVPLYKKIKKDNLLISTENEYINIKYKYKNPEVKEILDYIKYEMLPKLSSFDYELDWIYYTYLEHQIWYEKAKNYSKVFDKMKTENLEIIKKYLSILFEENNLDKFKKVEEEFWSYFKNQEIILKNIYEELIELHRN